MEDLTRLENFTTLLKQTNYNNTYMYSENKSCFLTNLFETLHYNSIFFTCGTQVLKQRLKSPQIPPSLHTPSPPYKFNIGRQLGARGPYYFY